MSADGHMVLYATFNDSLVHEQKYPWYGAALDTDDPAKVTSFSVFIYCVDLIISFVMELYTRRYYVPQFLSVYII